MGRFDKYLDEPAAKGGRFAKYADPEPPPPAKLNENGLPEGFVGPPSIQDDPNLKTVLPSIDTANRLRSEGRTVTGIDKSGTISLAPLPGQEVRSVLSHKDDKEPKDRKKPDEVRTSSELQDAQSRPVYDPYGPLKAFGTSAVESASLGFDDEYGALLMDGNYDNNVDALRRAKKAEQAKDPQMATAGSLFGGALVPIGGMGGSALRTIATGAGVGAASALGSTEKRLTGPDRDLTGAAWDVAKGAGMGLAGGSLIAGGKAIKNFVTSAPERIATRADNDLFNAATRKMTPTEHKEMLGRLAEKKGDLLALIREDPKFESAVMKLATDKTEDAARAAAAIADSRASAAMLADSRTRNLLTREAGPIAWEDITTPLETEAQKRASSLVPSVAKTGEEIAGIAEKVRERHMPVEGQTLLSRVAKDVDSATLARIDRDPESYAQVLTKAKAGKAIDNPAKVVEKLGKLEETILAKTTPIRKAAGDMTLRELSETITRKAQEIEKANPAQFVATGAAASDHAKPIIERLWKAYAPEHVNADGKVILSPAAMNARISVDEARSVVSKLQSRAFDNPLGESPADKIRKAISMAAKENVDEMVARNLSPKKAAEFADLNRQESRIISLRDGLEAKAIKARLAEVPPQEFPRTGKIDPREIMNASKEAKSPEAQELLSKIVESHMGKSRVSAIKAAEERAKLSGELADAIAGRVRETAGGRKPGIREIKNENIADASAALKVGGLVTAASAPMVGAGMIAGALGMRASRDQIARSIDRGIEAMANAAKRTTNPKVLFRVGQIAGLGSEIAGDVVNILSTRTYPGKIGKEE